MKEAGDIVTLAVPFTLGTGAGALIKGHLSFIHGHIAAGVAILFCTTMLVRLAGRRGSTVTASILFLTLGIFCYLSFDCAGAGITVPEHGIQAFPERCLSKLQAGIRALPFRHESTNSLVCALLTGDRSSLSPEHTEAFRTSGASHILALSGLHLGVIYLIIKKMLSIIGNSRTAIAARSAIIVAFSGFYTLMTGAGPSIVRAFLFILLNEISNLSPERRRNLPGTLLTALTIQLALKPAVISSTGFQLSYLAMAGIMLVYPQLSSWYPDDGRLKGMNPLKKLWDSTALTVSCQIFTAPLVWIRFHTFPKYFIITNLIALPMTSAVMSVSVAVICLSSMGICPGMLVRADELLVQGLLFALQCISAM